VIHVPINRRTLPFIASAAVAVIGGCMYIQSRDVALSKARTFAATAPEVINAVGPNASTTVMKSVYYQGVPGKEPAYRQYTMLVTGQTGSSITIQVRAYPTDTEGVWDVQLRSAN
jgi:hypothetical protein